MKPAHTPFAPSVRKLHAVILLAVGAAVLTTAACTAKAKPAVHASQSSSASVHPVEPAASAAGVSQPAPVAAVKKTSSAAKPSATQLLSYRSRDYGVSFLYPWQYTIRGARAIAGDESLQPKSDGTDGQVTLARVDVPRGFYSDTDFESGYFILSLNQDLDQAGCESALGAAKDAKVETVNINGADFHALETDSGGHGSAAKLRRYVTFSNATCFEVELGVKTGNDGMSREVDPDQVLRRLDAILQTLKLAPSKDNAVESVKAEK